MADTLDDVSAAGLLREVAILVVTVSIAAHVIYALVRLINETESARRRPREAHRPSDGLPEIHRGERSDTLRGTSLPMARDAQRPRARDGVTRASMPPVRETSSEDKADCGALPGACRPELAPVTSSMNCPCPQRHESRLVIPAAQKRSRPMKVSSGSLFYSRVVEQQVRASKSEWSSTGVARSRTFHSVSHSQKSRGDAHYGVARSRSFENFESVSQSRSDLLASSC